VGQLRNRFAHPNEKREVAPTVLRLGGQKFLAVESMYAGRQTFYRFAPGTEFTEEVLRLDASRASFDSNGDMLDVRDTEVRRRKFTGLDAKGTPTFGAPEVVKVPAPFTGIGRGRYDAQHDVLYLAGFTKERPPWQGADKVMGTVLARYDNWSKGNRRATWTTVLPYDAQGTIHTSHALGLVSMDRAGDGRIYATMLTHEGTESQARVYEYDEATGKLITYWLPGSTFGGTGWVDLLDGIRARLLPNGETLVFQEEDFRAKIVMYRIAPKA
jgi:hypothetical protein